MEEEEAILHTVSREAANQVKLFPPGCMNIVNVTASFSLGVPFLDYDRILAKYDFAFVDLEKFPALIFHTQPPRTSALMYQSGQVAIVGSTSVWASFNVAHRYAELVRDAGYPEAGVYDFKPSSYSATVRLPFVLDINRYSQFVDSPLLHSNFPFLITNKKILKNGKASHTLYLRNIVLTGAKTEQDLLTSFLERYPFYRQFSVPDGTPEALELERNCKIKRKAELTTKQKQLLSLALDDHAATIATTTTTTTPTLKEEETAPTTPTNLYD